MVLLTSKGERLRGFSHDFVPGRNRFHFTEVSPSGEMAGPRPVDIDDVHAVFFVRDFAFDRKRRYTAADAPPSSEEPPTAGARRLRVRCVWGEVIEGLSYGYEPERPGFFVFPTGPEERVYNLERAFLTRQAVDTVEMPAA